MILLSVRDLNAQTVRILPLGNSITEGSDLVNPPEPDRVSYRGRLYNLLLNRGYDFDFIGHGYSGWNLTPDPDHGGIPGTRASYMVRLLQDGYDIRWGEQITAPSGTPYLDAYPPDIILLHIGTNDVTHVGSDASSIMSILNEIDSWEERTGIHVTVFIARIINRNPYSSTTTDYNNNLESIVNSRQDPSIILVDMENGAGINYATEMKEDGLHPLPSAYQKMGDTWFNFIDTYLSAIPGTPDNLSIAGATDTSIQLSWSDNSGNETGFQIERSLTPAGGDFVLDGEVGPNVKTYTSSGLIENTRYYYRIRAVNATGPSFYTAAVSGVTSSSPPSAPDGLTFGQITGSTIEMSWRDNSDDEEGFQIYRSLSAMGDYFRVGTTDENVTTFVDSGLEDDTEYYYQVYAYNASGLSSYDSGHTRTLKMAPAQPDLIDAIVSGSCTVAITWADNSDNEDGFELERSSELSGGFELIATIEANTEIYIDTETENNAIYQYRLRAYNSTGVSPYSDTITVELSVVLDGGIIGENQTVCPLGDPEELVNLQSPAGGIENWNFQWQFRTFQGDSFINIPAASELTYDPPEGITQTTDFLRISNSACGSASSNIITVTVEDDIAPVFEECPDDIYVEADYNDLQVFVDTPDPVISDNCGITLQSWTLSGATSGSSDESGKPTVGRYEFALGTTNVLYYAEDYAGNTAQCDFDVVIEETPWQKPDIGGGDSLTMIIFPNPTSGSFTLTFSDSTSTAASALMKITDISGKIILEDRISLGNDETHIITYELSGDIRDGIYAVYLYLGTKSAAQRLLITRD